MKNSELLLRLPSSLKGLDRQRHYVLSLLTQKTPCPNCGTLQDFFEGAGIEIDDWEDRAGGTPCRCVSCGRGLIYVVPMFAILARRAWFWELIPISPKDGGAS